MANGIIVIDKPQGWTSHDVVAKLRGIYQERRIGHSGTLGLHNPGFVLDPAILPVGASIYARIVERRLPLKEAA